MSISPDDAAARVRARKPRDRITYAYWDIPDLLAQNDALRAQNDALRAQNRHLSELVDLIATTGKEALRRRHPE